MKSPFYHIRYASQKSREFLLILDKKNPTTQYPELPESLKNAITLWKDKKNISFFNHAEDDKIYHVQFLENKEKNRDELREKLRKAGASAFEYLSGKTDEIEIIPSMDNFMDWLEGFLLSSYSFERYKTREKKKDRLLTIYLPRLKSKKTEIQQLDTLCRAVFLCRDWVNEPVSFLNAQKLAELVQKEGTKAGLGVEILTKEKIKNLKMGGLMAVNQGSEIPPTFSIITYKPEYSVNQSPVVLVGKGIVFDTGGLSLKPTTNSMDYMKSDMAGAAVVFSVIKALADTNIPLYVIGLIPATDNRPGKNAMAPGDIITMHDQTTVEILNTDAEGRLILADALAFAHKFKPLLTIDIATLTGSAAVALGEHAAALFASAPRKFKKSILKSAYSTHEKLVELPLWKEYEKEIESSVADLKNLGSRYGGTIHAAKFLEHFAPRPWMHLDIAGVAFRQRKNYYVSSGSSGFGVRLLYDFLKNLSHESK